MSGEYPTGGSKGLGFEDLVAQDLKTGRFRPVYVLAGPDTLRTEGVVEKIRKDALGPGGAAFNFHVFHADQTPFAKIFQQAVSLPMLAGRQVIWVKQAADLLERQESLDHFEKYLRDPVPQTILILSLERADKRKKWVKVCQEAGFFFEMLAPTGEGLIQWILKAAQKEGLPLQREQAQLLAELLGEDLLGIKNELDKLALLFADRPGGLAAEDLSRLIMDQAQLKGYEITENLQPGQAGQVLRTWFRLAEWGRNPHEIAPLVLSRIRKGYLLEAARQAGFTDQEIGALTAQNPWSFRYLATMIRNMGTPGLRSGLKVALQCDRQLKSSPLAPDAVFEQAILQLCREGNREG